MKTLIRTLEGTNSELYQIYEGRRCKLTDCKVSLQLYEERQSVPSLGGSSIKKYKIGIALCSDVSDVTLKGIPEITTDILNQQGIYERFYLNNMVFVDGDDTTWIFELKDREQIKRLFAI